MCNLVKEKDVATITTRLVKLFSIYELILDLVIPFSKLQMRRMGKFTIFIWFAFLSKELLYFKSMLFGAILLSTDIHVYSFWAGASDTEQEGRWVWSSDGETVSFCDALA